MRLPDELSRHIPLLKRFARRALGDVTEVEDLVQETLAAALGQQEGYAGRSSLSTWLVGILSHKVIDHLKRHTRQRQQVEPLEQSELAELTAAPPSRSPERALAHRQAVELIERALPTLPEYERMAVLLIDVQGLDRDQVCNDLGLTPTHLRVLLHRGRNRLRRVLEDVRL